MPADDPARGSDVVLDRLLSLHPKIIDLSLDRVWRLLDRLGHPERHMPPAIHVAGTNGKGSLIAFLRAMLEADGKRVHAYTSPHLVRFHERIRLAGDLISETDLLALLEEAEAANGGEPITFFEITTCAAFLAFARTPADVLLLETGLGGRLDATNVLDRPQLTAITPVGMDHMQYLGNTLSAIAGEKAGILKPGVPAVVAPQDAAARDVIADRATALDTPLALGGRDWTVTANADGSGFTYRDPATDEASDWPAPALLGPYQIDNAGMAVACARRLDDLAPSDRAIRDGLARALWPGRFHTLAPGELTARVPDGWETWVDGGHNAEAGQALAAAVDAWTTGDAVRRPLHLVVGMINSKEPRDFLTPLAARADSITAVAVPGEPATFGASETAAFARRAGNAPVHEADSIGLALDGIAGRARGDEPPARILVCGSLYLAGRVLALNAHAPT
jgi:dihydrofolate synthase/folylpolyglutamate synthase